MLSPSAIQRAEDFVGMAMPMVPLSCATACRDNDIRPIANAVKPSLNGFILFFGDYSARGGAVIVHGMKGKLNFYQQERFHRSGERRGSVSAHKGLVIDSFFDKQKHFDPALHSFRKSYSPNAMRSSRRRKSKNLTIDDIAELSGVSYQTVSRVL